MRRFHLATAVYVVLLIGTGVIALGPVADPPPIGHAARGITKQQFLTAPGHWFGVTTPSAPSDTTGLRKFATAAQKAPSVWMYWRDWSKPLTAHDIRASAKQRVVPMIAWEPWKFGQRDLRARKYSLRTIIDGKWDALIDKSAQAVVAADTTVVIRFAHEMNGTWYPWGTRNGNRPGEYAAAWRHVWDRFQRAGANRRVVWIWSPNNVRVTNANLASLYPGDRYVDLVGMSGFLGYGTLTRTQWPDFNASFGATMLVARTFTQKKFFITEMGALEKYDLKERWIRSVFDGIDAHPDIVGFLWFDIDRPNDWRITSTEISRRVFASRVASGQYH